MSPEAAAAQSNVVQGAPALGTESVQEPVVYRPVLWDEHPPTEPGHYWAITLDGRVEAVQVEAPLPSVLPLPARAVYHFSDLGRSFATAVPEDRWRRWTPVRPPLVETDSERIQQRKIMAELVDLLRGPDVCARTGAPPTPPSVVVRDIEKYRATPTKCEGAVQADPPAVAVRTSSASCVRVEPGRGDPPDPACATVRAEQPLAPGIRSASLMELLRKVSSDG